MAVQWIGLGGLFAELLDATRPILDRGGEARKHHDRAMKEAEGQVATAPKQEAPPLRVARAIPVARISELEAEPPLHWTGSGWRCAGATTVTVRADGGEHTVELGDGAELPVRAGMLLVPPAGPTAGS
jgi:hypothetical protein